MADIPSAWACMVLVGVELSKTTEGKMAYYRREIFCHPGEGKFKINSRPEGTSS